MSSLKSPTEKDTRPVSELGHVAKADSDIDIGELEDTSDYDDAELFLRSNGYTWAQVMELASDEGDNKRLLRKIDWALLPLLCGTFMFQFVDKASMSYSAVFDLFTDAHISGSDYSWLGSWFSLGYLLFEYPGTYLGQHFPTGTVIGIDIILWGAILTATAGATGYPGLAAARFFLGGAESLITPLFMMIVSSWYRREEQPARAGVFYCFNGIGSILGSALAVAAGHIDGFPVWKSIFLLCGGLTLVWGVIVLTFLPNSPLTARRFSTAEKILIIGRNKANQTGMRNQKIKLYQIREAFLDPQIWILFAFATLNQLINAGVSNFGKLIIKSVVHDPITTAALGIPSGVFQTFYIFTGCYLASKFKNMRCIIMATWNIPTIIGVCIVWKLPRTNTVGSLFGYYIIGSFVASVALCLQLPGSNVGGYSKRVTATAFVFLGFCLGNILGTHAFKAAEAPRYKTGCIMMLASSVGQIVLAIYLRLHLQWRNRKRDKAASMGGLPQLTGEEAMTDITDFKNPYFRYNL